MSSHPLIRFAYDPTGVNPDNLVVGEVHTLSNKPVRAIAPHYGAFYTDSLQIFDNTTDTLLQRNTQYRVVELLQDASLRIGKEICMLILILDPAVSPQVRINYQVLGGLYQNNTEAIQSLYEAIQQENRPVNWLNVLDKPLQYDPTIHNHVLADMYGFEPLVSAMERIRNAIILSDVPAFEAMLDWVNAQLTILSNNDTSMATALSGKVELLDKATEAEAEAGTIDTKWMTPLRTKDAIAQFATASVGAATETAAGKVELATAAETTAGTDTTRAVHPAGLKVELDKKVNTSAKSTTAQAQAGTDDATWMTPLKVAQAITQLSTAAVPAASETVAGKVELATAAETTTGTDTTRAVHPAGLKVELDKKVNVAALATTTEAQSGTDDSKWMTPKKVADAITSRAPAAVATATETTQGKVELATSAETITGTDATRATHPAGVKAAIDTAIANLIAAAPGSLDTLNELAAALGDDPNFATTMTNALAGKVNTSALATTTEAQTGTDDTKWMTPKKVADAITSRTAAAVPVATETLQGKVELATTAETTTGTDTTRATHPAGVKAAINAAISAHTHSSLVNGTGTATLDASGNFTVSGDVTAFSDPRLKEVKGRITNALDICDRLDGVVFTWRKDIPAVFSKAGKRDYGLLTTQVKEVMPEIVVPGPQDEITGQSYDTMMYDKLIPLLLEAIKELRQEVNVLKASKTVY